MKNTLQILPGLGLSILVAAVGILLENQLKTQLGSSTLALLIGLLVGNTTLNKPIFQSGIKYAESKILAYSIILMGLGLQLQTLLKLSLPFLSIIVVSIFFVYFVSLYIGKRFGLSRTLSILLGSGSAICGSSAIAAVAPTIKAKQEEVGLAIGIINLLGTIGIFLLPIIATIVDCSEENKGLLIGGTLQAVGHVVAAGFAINVTIGNLATLVKMGRVLMLGPMLLIINRLEQKQQAELNKIKFTIPFFVTGFFVATIVRSVNLLPESIISNLSTLGHYLVIISMAGIGLKINIKSMLSLAPKSMLVGISIFMVQIAFFIAVLKLLTLLQ